MPIHRSGRVASETATESTATTHIVVYGQEQLPRSFETASFEVNGQGRRFTIALHTDLQLRTTFGARE